MQEFIVKRYEEQPLFLNAQQIANVLGVSISSAYELMHEKDFPSLRIGNSSLSGDFPLAKGVRSVLGNFAALTAVPMIVLIAIPLNSTFINLKGTPTILQAHL